MDPTVPPVDPSTPPVSEDQDKKTSPPKPPDNAADVVTMSKADYDKLIARMDGMSANIERLKKAKEDPAPPTDQKPKPTTVEQDKAFKDLQAQVEKFQSKQDRANARDAKHALRRVLEGKKVNAEQAENIADLLYRANKDNIVFDDDDKPMYRESEDKASGLEEWAVAFLESAAGSVLLPTKRAPNVPSGATEVSNGKVYYTEADMREGRVDPADIKSGKAVLRS